MSALRSCRFGDRWEIVRDVDGVGRRIGILHSTADADRFVASEDLLAAARDARALLMLADSTLPGWNETVNGLAAAIAKAEGRS